MSNFKINFGDPHEEFVLPTVEDCLRKYDASFYSAQNAIRIHEWLGDASAVSLLLTKVGTKEEVDIMSPNIYHRLIGIYPPEMGVHVILTKTILTKIVPLHQIALALPDLIVAKDQSDNSPEREKYIQDNINVMVIATAAAIVHNTYLPKSLVYVHPDTLPLVLMATITQRARVSYTPCDTTNARMVDNDDFSPKEIMIFGLAFNHLNAMIAKNIYDSPGVVASGLMEYMSVDDFKQIAMATSYVFGYKYPKVFYSEHEQKMYHRAASYFARIKMKLISFPTVKSKDRSHLRTVK